MFERLQSGCLSRHRMCVATCLAPFTQQPYLCQTALCFQMSWGTCRIGRSVLKLFQARSHCLSVLQQSNMTDYKMFPPAYRKVPMTVFYSISSYCMVLSG